MSQDRENGPQVPPSAGTGERSSGSPLPPAGRVDAERATWGSEPGRVGNVAEGTPPENVGGAQGSRPADPLADQPVDDIQERAGYHKPREGERRP
jgi:hypothetical protein